jgi:fructuronate reductase
MTARLGPDTIAALPREVRRPRYDRAALAPGILHLGVGAFHRCHQAEWTDDALEADFGAWGIRGVNLAPPDLAATLGAQAGLHCRELREAGRSDLRLIGANIGTTWTGTPDGAARARAWAADPATRAITMTVTEKGYCHHPATGALDPDHPAIVADLADPGNPTSVPGFVTRMLRDRAARGAAPPVLISCDNVPDNGATLRRCVTGFAAALDPALADLIAAEITFLDTMVDRIVPATRPEDLDRFEAATGLRDEALVVGEPFRMWVIQDRGVDLPAWDRAGAILTPDVRPYEILKMRVVNGIQSNLCQLGLLSGVPFMADVMADPVFAEFAERTIRREVVPHLPPVPGVDVDGYLVTTLSRLANPDLRHGTAQISTDGSRKVRQRLLDPLRDARRAGGPWRGLALGVAGWMGYMRGVDHAGRPHPVDDPLADRAKAVADAAGSARDRVAGMLAIREVFGTDLSADAELVDHLATCAEALERRPARDVVRESLAA